MFRQTKQFFKWLGDLDAKYLVIACTLLVPGLFLYPLIKPALLPMAVLAVALIYFSAIGPRGRKNTLLLYEGMPFRLFTDRIKRDLPRTTYVMVPIVLVYLFYAAVFQALFLPEDSSIGSIAFVSFWLLVGVIGCFGLLAVYQGTGLASFLVSLIERREPGFAARKMEAQEIVTDAFDSLRIRRFEKDVMAHEVKLHGLSYLKREAEIVARHQDRNSPLHGEHQRIRMAYFALRHLDAPEELLDSTGASLIELLGCHKDYEWDILQMAKQRLPELMAKEKPQAKPFDPEAARMLQKAYAEFAKVETAVSLLEKIEEKKKQYPEFMDIWMKLEADVKSGDTENWGR